MIEDFHAQQIIRTLNSYFFLLSISEGTSVESTIEWEFTSIQENDAVTRNLTVKLDY